MADEQPKPSSTFTRYSHRVSGEELELLERKLKENPDNFDLLDWAAFAYYSSGDMARAVEYYDRLVLRFPGNASYYYYLGNAQYQLGSLGTARNHWRRVIQLDDTKNFASRAERKLKNLGDG